MIGTNSASSFCEISELLRICVDRSVWESMAPISAPTNSVCRSGLAENCANELFTSTAVFATTPPRSSITNCGELHRIGDVVIGSQLQQRTGHRAGCFCQAALSF